MKRTILIAVVLAAVVVAAAATVRLLGQPRAPRPEPGAATAAHTTAPARDVRVQHDLVTIAVPAAAHVFAPAAHVFARKAPSRPATVTRVSRTRPQLGLEKDPLLVKAGRAILGNGRYRPEPFPRVK